MHKKGKEGITVLRRKIFVTAPTLFKEKSLCQKNAGIEKCKELEREEGHRDFWSILSSLPVPKNYVRELLCFGKIQVSQSFIDKSGGGREVVPRVFIENFSSQGTEKLCRWTLLFQKISFNEKC